MSEQLSQSVLSFTRATLVVKVSGGFTRDLQVMPGHLQALPGHLAALPGHLAVAYPLDPAVAWAPAGFGGR